MVKESGGILAIYFSQYPLVRSFFPFALHVAFRVPQLQFGFFNAPPMVYIFQGARVLRCCVLFFHDVEFCHSIFDGFSGLFDTVSHITYCLRGFRRNPVVTLLAYIGRSGPDRVLVSSWSKYVFLRWRDRGFHLQNFNWRGP